MTSLNLYKITKIYLIKPTQHTIHERYCFISKKKKLSPHTHTFLFFLNKFSKKKKRFEPSILVQKIVLYHYEENGLTFKSLFKKKSKLFEQLMGVSLEIPKGFQ